MQADVPSFDCILANVPSFDCSSYSHFEMLQLRQVLLLIQVSEICTQQRSS